MFTTSPQHWKDPPNDFSWFGPAMLSWWSCSLQAWFVQAGTPQHFQTRLFLCREMDAYRHQQIYWNIPRRSKSDAPALNIRFFFGTHSTDIALEIHGSLLKTDVYIHDRCSIPFLFTGGTSILTHTQMTHPLSLWLQNRIECGVFRPRSSSQGPC